MFVMFECRVQRPCQLLRLTLILLTWRIWWAPNNASKWQMGFNSAFKWLNRVDDTRMSTEDWWNDTDRGKSKYSKKNPSQCHFVHHISHTDRPVIEHGPPLWQTLKITSWACKDQLKVRLYPTVLDFRNSIAFWKVPRFRPLVLLVRAKCIWRWEER